MPWHVWHASSSCTGTVASTPLQRVVERDAHLDLDVVATLAALRLLLAPPAAVEEAAEDVAEVEVAEVEGRAAGRRPPKRPFVEPIASYCLRFSGSESTSYADCTSLKRSSLPGVPVRMHLADELAVRLLELVLQTRSSSTPSDSYRLLAIAPPQR